MTTKPANWSDWITTYLSDPTEEHAVDGAVGLARMIASDPNVNQATVLAVASFIGQVWAQWPKKAPGFLVEALAAVSGPEAVGDGVSRGMVLLMGALCPPIAPSLDDITPLNETDATELESVMNFRKIFGGGATIHEVEITEAFHLDLLWGAFMGSGDSKFIVPILGCTRWVDGRSGKRKGAIGKAAVWSLGSNYDRHAFTRLAMNGLFEDNPKWEADFRRGMALHNA